MITQVKFVTKGFGVKSLVDRAGSFTLNALSRSRRWVIVMSDNVRLVADNCMAPRRL